MPLSSVSQKKKVQVLTLFHQVPSFYIIKKVCWMSKRRLLNWRRPQLCKCDTSLTSFAALNHRENICHSLFNLPVKQSVANFFVLDANSETALMTETGLKCFKVALADNFTRFAYYEALPLSWLGN